MEGDSLGVAKEDATRRGKSENEDNSCKTTDGRVRKREENLQSQAMLKGCSFH